MQNFFNPSLGGIDNWAQQPEATHTLGPDLQESPASFSVHPAHGVIICNALFPEVHNLGTRKKLSAYRVKKTRFSAFPSQGPGTLSNFQGYQHLHRWLLGVSRWTVSSTQDLIFRERSGTPGDPPLSLKV